MAKDVASKIAKLDGHKTSLGLFLLYIAPFVPNPSAQLVLNWVGGILAGTGAVHKVTKILS